MIARCAVVCAMLGCTTEVTEVVIVTGSDLTIPFEIDQVRFSVDARQAGGGVEDRLVALAGPGAARLPLRLPIVSRGTDLGPVTVTAVGLDDGRPRIDRRATFSFVPGTSYEVALDLMRDCIAVHCRGDQTCAAGRCVPIGVPGMPADSGVDAGVDAGSTDSGSDAGAPDACPSSCACTASCDISCRCRRGCSCDLACPSGARCEDVRCEEDSSCGVQGGDDGVLIAECRAGALCEVRCGGVEVCRVRCLDRADCLLFCETAGDCGFEECAGEAMPEGAALHCMP